MRTAIPAAAMAAALLVISSSPANAAPPHDQVRGKGTIAGSSTIQANVRSDADGTKPRGSFSFTNINDAGDDFRGQPTCILVVGNAAVIGGYDADNPSGYTQFFTYVIDNGESGDLALNYVAIGAEEPDQQDCADAKAFLDERLVFFHPVDGDFAVVDR
jgi:hypothetical protein